MKEKNAGERVHLLSLMYLNPSPPESFGGKPTAVFLTPMVGLRLGELVGFEHPYVLIEPVFPAAPLQFLYLGHYLIQDILIVDDA